MVDNAVAHYVVHFANYLLPLITVPYTVRVLTPSGYGLGAFAVSFAGFFGTVADYGFSLNPPLLPAPARGHVLNMTNPHFRAGSGRDGPHRAHCVAVFGLIKSILAEVS